MIRKIQNLWAELSRSIFVGDRYEKNMRGLTIGAALIVLVNLATGFMNVKQGYTMGAVSSLVLIVSFSVVLFLIVVKKNRSFALAIALTAVIVIYTYDVVTVTTPIMPIWTLMFPWAFSYLMSVKAGVGLSAYFTALYMLLFYTPLRQFVEGRYPEIIVERFPILYLVNAVLCIYIMVQYHRNTLHQMDYAGQLVEAKEAADRANEAKSSFLANMSHEIRTPINAVLGMNEMIERESVSAREALPESREAIRAVFSDISGYSANIESAGHNLLSIINDILDFSKIESGKMEIVEAYYQFSSVLNDVSNMILFKAREKGLEFRVEADERLPDGLRGDEVRVRQVVTNLLNNAVKYTKAGSVTLSVRLAEDAEVREGETVRLLISVTDTGIGIRDEDMARLFKKFERVDLQSNSTVEGTGLGLAITSSLLEMMGGSIRVESEYGRGSTFTVELPQRVVSAEPMGDFREKFEHSLQQAAVYHGAFRAPDARILIVDDTRMNLTVAVGLLKKTALQIDTAGSGAQAVELAQDVPYDLILMDQRMPGMDGTEAMVRIKKQYNGANARTPFICLTADAVSGARSRYLAEGFTDYLSKPIDSKALEAMLMKYLPAEKVLPVEETAPDSAAPDADAEPGAFDPLREAGIEPKVGLRYCQEDADFYRSVLAEYAQGEPEKARSLSGFLASGDWQNYGVLAHALKSTSRMIGAAALSERAARMEQAANVCDGDAIRAEHEAMLAEYAAAARAIRAAVPEAAELAGDEGALEFLPETDGGVLEFSPDDGVLEFTPDDGALEFPPVR